MTRTAIWTLIVLAIPILAIADDAHKIASVDAAPAGLSEDIAATLNEEGYRVTGPEGTVCDIWLAKSLATVADFEPTLSINYPLTPGQLIGALHIGEDTEFSDFRGQPIAGGTYTLRYGQQPEDGNHIGTSETADFLLALPGKMDSDPKVIEGFDQLSERSAQSAGSSHPAIFSLLKVEEPQDKATFTEDENTGFWVVQISTKTKKAPLHLRLIIIGESEG